MSPPRPILLVFLDGVGIGEDDPDRNPFLRAELPAFTRLAGGTIPTLSNPAPPGERSRVLPLDATMGMEGLPRSGTGQVALLTGRNAARLLGRHFGPWVPVALRPLLHRENLLSGARNAGFSAAFANAYPVRFLDAPSRRWAGPPTAALAAGLLTRHEASLLAGDAVASELDNEAWRTRLGLLELPRITLREAGHRLARIARGHHLTLFAHYSTDLAGHRQEMAVAVEALEKVDRFLGGVLEALPRDHLLVLASDHGNIEDTTAGHTRNPALGIVAWGQDSLRPGGDLPTSLMEIQPALARWLEEAAPPLQASGP
jgi:2,3-bisphosphoglycerate-independent phosphoglycerate mutase